MLPRTLTALVICIFGLLACRRGILPSWPVVSTMYPLEAYIEGEKFTPTQAETINRNLPGLASGDPSRIFNRIQLLGYYDARPDSESVARTRELIIWLAENEPSVNLCWRPIDSRKSFSKQEFEQIKQLWLDQTEKHPTEPIVFCNAAHFLMADDYLYSCLKVEELLDKAAMIGSNNSDIHSLIAEYYYDCSISDGAERENRLLNSSISEYQKALGIIDQRQFPSSYSRQDVLTGLTKVTFRIGDIDRAVFYAKDLLKTMPPASQGRPRRGDQINLANTVLGLNAIKLGDIEAAGNYLIASAVGEAHIDPYSGPNMCLAKSLSESGKQRVVVEYLRKCEAMWPKGIETLHKWEAMIDKGENPSFYCNVDTW